jgi:hypothetical protein
VPLFRAKIYSFEENRSEKSPGWRAVPFDLVQLSTWHILCLTFSNMKTPSTPRTKKRGRGAQVIFGPPGLFIGLTLAALIAGAYIGRSATAVAVPQPVPPAANR